tara:strand:- start:39 stop:218 length:180 start_codon:yes stop_codon:yes gene_type:complete
MEKQLSEFELSSLRDKGILRENEVAYKVGDLVVAENVITRERRVLEEIVNENRKRILKG